MKTITILSVLAEAISTCTTAINMVLGQAKDDPEVDHICAELKGDNYLLMSTSMTVVRDLLKSVPEEIVGEELESKRLDFYVHLFEEDNPYDLNKLHHACHTMHRDIFRIYNTALEAIRLYT